MSRKSQARNLQYTRQTKAWQQNQMKQQQAMAGYAKGMPKMLDGNKLKKFVIIGGISVLVLTILLTIFFGWVGFFIGFGITIAATVGVILFMRKKETDIVRYYKKMGVSKGDYIKMMRKANKQSMDEKTLKRFTKTWDKIK